MRDDRRYSTESHPLATRLVVLTLLGLLLLGGFSASWAGSARSPSAVRSTPRIDTISDPSVRALTAENSPDATFTLTVDGDSAAAIALSWTNPESLLFSKYAVDESSAGAGGPWDTVGVVTNVDSDTAYAVTGLSPGATYWWEVVETYGIGGTTETTNVVTHTQPGVGFLNSTGLTSSTVTLVWSNNETYGGFLNFSSYEVYESVNGAASGVADTLDQPSAHSDTITGLAPGTGYAFYVVTNDCTDACGTGGATLSSTQSNSISIGTPFALEVSLSAKRAVIDVGELAYFTCTPSGGEQPYSFAWNFGNGTFSPGNGSVGTTYGLTGSPTVVCRVTDNESTMAEASLALTVNSAPTLDPAVNRTAADIGQVIDFNCTVSGGTTPATIGWNFGDGGAAAVGSATHVYEQAGPEVATCSATDGAGVPVAGGVSLTISPTFSTSISVNWSAAAPDSPLTFTAHPENGSGSYTAIQWSFGDGSVGAGPSVQHGFSKAGAFTISLTESDSNGARATSQASVTISPIAITVQVASTATIGNPVTFASTAAGGAGAPYNYTWNFGDGAVGYGPSAAHSYQSVGTFHPTVTVRDRLNSAEEQNVSEIAVAAAPLPPVTPLPFASVFPWVLLVIATFVGLLVGAVAYRRSRGEESVKLERMGGWVPPTPSHTVGGMKVCTYCHHANVPLRRTCSACGKPLPRGPGN